MRLAFVACTVCFAIGGCAGGAATLAIPKPVRAVNPLKIVDAMSCDALVQEQKALEAEGLDARRVLIAAGTSRATPTEKIKLKRAEAITAAQVRSKCRYG